MSILFGAETLKYFPLVRIIIIETYNVEEMFIKSGWNALNNALIIVNW